MHLLDKDAVVFDLDGTLAILDVDWPGLREELAALLADSGVAVDDVDPGVWNYLERAENAGIGEAAHARIRDHELVGATDAARLPLADRVAPLAAAGVRVGVCSLNSTEAVRTGLETLGLAGHVDAVVGREPGMPRKPDPSPLRATLDELEVATQDAVFVGDSEGDEATAAAADVRFRYAADIDDSYPEDWAAVEWSEDASATELVDETYDDDG